MSPRKPKAKPKLPQWMETFRKNLRATRRRLNVSQQGLADRIGVFPQGISGIEAGRRPAITYDTAFRLAEGLGVSLDELMGVTNTTSRPGDARRIPNETIVESPLDLDSDQSSS